MSPTPSAASCDAENEISSMMPHSVSVDDQQEYCSLDDMIEHSSSWQDNFSPFARMRSRKRRPRISAEEVNRICIHGSGHDCRTSDRYICNQCGKPFSRPYNLRSHRKIHLGTKPFQCDWIENGGVACIRRFSRKHDLQRHIHGKHSKNERDTI